jgi:Zn ribbon nucleic-acid-binding protein
MPKKIPDYSLCKVYKLVSPQTDKVYIGSTCQKYLSSRFAQHKTDYKLYLNSNNKSYYTSFEIVKYPDAKIILVQSYPQCKNNMEQRMYEQDYIDIYDCVNKQRAYSSPEQYKEYNDAHKEERAIYSKQYYENNREQILEKEKQKVICECGAVLNRSSLSKHRNKQIHQTNLNNLSLKT